MAHLTSFKANGAVGVLRHDERTENDEVHSRKNECIDITRTSLNYNLAPKRTGKLMEHIRQVCDDNNVRLNNRKDLNVMSSWVVTVPKTVPSQQYQLFFQRCYDFLKKRYGEKYVLSATVHMDETTPHMHYSFIPVGLDTKNNRLTVSSKLVATRTELRNCQQELSNSLDKEFGYNLGILNEATKDGNKTIQELKYKTTVEKIEKAEHKLENLQGRILKQEEVNAIKGKKTLTGGLKDVTYNEYLSLKKTAQYVNKAKRTVEKLKDDKKELKNTISELENDLKKAKEVRISKENIIKNEMIKKINEKYQTHYYYQVPRNSELIKDIRKNICCKIGNDKENECYIVQVPYSERETFDKMYKEYCLDQSQQKQQRNHNPLIR